MICEKEVGVTIRGLILVSVFMCFYLASAAPAHAVANRHSAKQLLPPGNYLCQMGSYKFRPCRVVAKGDGVQLVIPANKGHFIAMTAEILPSDIPNQLTVYGRFLGKARQCPACSGGKPGSKCPATAKQKTSCDRQALVARLKKRGKQFSGMLYYFILRYSYGKKRKPLPLFKLGNAIRFSVKPAS